MKTYKISEESLTIALNTLAKYPYIEVVKAIQALQGVEEIKESQVPDKTKVDGK